MKQLNEVKALIEAFQEASRVTFSLVFIPTVLLLIAVFLDKKYHTTPLFILVGIVFGISLGTFKVISLEKKKKNKI